MNYNVKIDVERIRGNYVGNIEVSGVGRSGHRQVVAATFDEMQAKMKIVHDELLGNVRSYHDASAPSAPPTHYSEALIKPAPAKASAPKVAPKKSKAKKGARTSAPAQKKEPVRSFASA